MYLITVGDTQRLDRFLEPSAVKAMIALAEGKQPAFVPPELVEGNLASWAHEWVAGPRLVCFEDDGTSYHKIEAASERCMAMICHRAAELQRLLEQTLDPELITSVSPWIEYGFMLVAGLLLDLEIGDVLRSSERIGALPTSGCILAVPYSNESQSFGVRCSYDDEKRIGACVCWHVCLPSPGPLPSREGLRGLAQLLEGGKILPGVHLALRYQGWVRANRVTTPVLQRVDALWTAIRRLAEDLVDTIYGPLLLSLERDVTATPGRRVLISRMVMERTLSRLRAEGTVQIEEGQTKSRWCFRGPLWAIGRDVMRGAREDVSC